MITPIKVEFDVGQTRHKQPVKLIREYKAGGRPTWTIVRQAFDQRDNQATIRDLEPETILAMAEAVKNFPGT